MSVYLKQQVIIQASFVKDDGTLFIIFNFIFSRLLFILLYAGEIRFASE